MGGLNGRLRRLENDNPVPEPNDYTIYDLAREILAAIERGHIADHVLTGIWRKASLLDPSVPDHCTGDERSEAWRLLYAAEKLTKDICRVTGWRSPLAAGDDREWLHWRCNSAQEMSDLMTAVLQWEDRHNERRSQNGIL